jgi:hypothetical protein
VDTTIARAHAKQIQIIPNKSKQKSLDLLGFLWPIRDFSKGYTRKNKKICFGLNSRRRLRPTVSCVPLSPLARLVRRPPARLRFCQLKTVARYSASHKESLRHTFPMAGSSSFRRVRPLSARRRHSPPAYRTGQTDPFEDVIGDAKIKNFARRFS